MINFINIITIIIAIIPQTPANPMQFHQSTHPYVVGGKNVNIEENPFVVACLFYEAFTCGASIINEEWVLTAAHCTCFEIQYGVNQTDVSRQNVIKVEKAIRYPGFTSFERNDIQLLHLAEKIQFSESAQPVKLPPPQWEVKGDSFTVPSAVFGWGVNTWGTLSKTLQRGDYFVMNNTDCKKVHEGYYEVYDFNCCNGVKGGGVADCSGDSGGPIVTWINGKLVQYGIVSWSIKPCINPDFPAVGTKTSHYVEWISNTTGIPLSELTV